MGLGRVQQRLHKAKINTAEEVQAYLKPESTFYSNLGTECIEHRITMDMFVAMPPGNQTQADLATISPVVGVTGGDLNYFPNF